MANITKNNRRKVERIDNSFGKYSPEVVARPVDTFIRHQAPDNVGSEYLALAQSLSALSPQLNSILKRRQEEQAAQDEARGQKLYHEHGERLSWEDYRKSVPKLPGLNDSVRNGYLKARMANEANVFRTALNDAYASGSATIELQDGTKIPVAESDDPAVFNLWLNRFTKEYIRDNLGESADPEYFVKEFVPQVEAAGQELGSRHISERNHILWSRNIAEHRSLVSGTLGTLVRDGGVHLDDTSITSSAGYISNVLHDMAVSGVPSKEAREAVVDALIVAASDPDIDNGEDLFELAHHIKMADGSSLWNNGDTAKTLTRAAENVMQQRHYRENERNRVEKERQEEERIALGNRIADYVLSGKAPLKEDEVAYRHLYSVEDFSRLTSALRNIREGYRDRSRGGGGGGGSESKAAKAFADAVKTNYLRKHAMGADVSVLDVMNDPNVAALKYSDQKAIIDMFMKDTKETRDLLKDMAGGNKDIIDAELNYAAEGDKSQAGEVNYLKDVAYKRAATEINFILHDHPTLPVTASEKFRDMVRTIHREAAKQVKADKDVLITEGYEEGIPASDPKALEKSVQSRKKKETEQATASSKGNQSIADELMKRGLDVNGIAF